MDIILIGAQASGKGTQAELLTQILGIPHISSGDLFREEIDQQTKRGRRIQMYIERGELVPDNSRLHWFCAAYNPQIASTARSWTVSHER